MNVIKYRVSLDLFDTLSQATIKAKKCDSACQIHITLTEHGKIYNISEGCYATFNAKKSDGTFVYNNCTIEGNTIVYDFEAAVDEDGVCQVSAREGIVECEVTLYTANSEQLTSPRFTLFIDGTVYNGEEIVSSPNFDAFKKSVEHKMDKFGEVTETGDEILIKLNSFKPNDIGKPLRIETADGHTELVLRDWDDYAYFRVGDSIIKSIAGSKGWNFDKTALKDIGEPNESTDATTKGYVDNLVGDIETALDSIIALQNFYIGGETE